MFYIVALDCNRETLRIMKKFPKVEFEVKFLVNGEDHFPYEEQGLLGWHVLLLLIGCVLISTCIYSYSKFIDEHNRLDSPHITLIVILSLDLVSVFLQVLHLYIYSKNGKGVAAADIFTIVFIQMAEVAQSVHFFLMAQGWTVTFDEMEWDNFEFYLPIGSIVIAMHLVLGVLTYIDNEAAHKYHDFDGLQGYFLIAFKICLFIYFIYQWNTNDKVPRKAQPFFRVIGIIGTVFFMTIPVLILSAWFVAQSSRLAFVTVGSRFV